MNMPNNKRYRRLSINKQLVLRYINATCASITIIILSQHEV
ncbi:MAG: hypothetical protein ACJA1I_001913 [Zhongshania marina]|jgi:hypothetical protein